MSPGPFSHSNDLKRLREEGYFVQIRGGLLILREVPYVTASKEIKTGTIISGLSLAGDVTQKPDSHQVWFDGEFPCDVNGVPLTGIGNGGQHYDLGHGITAKFHFSTKPEGGYPDYYEKMTHYANLLAGPAANLKPGTTARGLRSPEAEDESVFNYTETASDRVGIGALTERLAGEKIAIIGLGGTGSYILDFVAKTPVREIRLFDQDEFLQHNAFRAPGAPSIEELREVPSKVQYLKGIYSKMHRGIIAHETRIDENNVGLFDGVTFAFLCMDAGEAKRQIVQKLESIGASFIDVGMGLELEDGSLGGILRVTASTPEKREHVKERVSFDDGAANDIYASNIQVADLNALNAVLAIIKWKKLRGFYRDLEQEHHCTYTTDGNMLLNGDLP
jgi:hypothetical protein